MKENIQDQIIGLVKEALKETGQASSLTEELYLDIPGASRFGDFSTNVALRLSKALNKPPREIAVDLIGRINKQAEKSPLKNYIKEIKVEGAGFINFYLEPKYLYQELEVILKKEKEALRLDLGKNEPVLIEFVSANPTGALSVAHARQAAVGDALANILSFLGFKVSREYYLNDEGNQINILGKSVELRMKENSAEKTDFPENYYQGEYIYDIAKKAKEKKIKTEDLGDFAAKFILDIIKKELDDFGVRFDCWYSQKGLGKSDKIPKAFELLKKKGFLYEQEGALWFKSSAFGDDKDRVVLKSDGTYTYLAPDIAYHDDKYKRGFKWLINLWGPDHHGYISRLKASVAALGRDPASLSIVIVQLATIFRDGLPIQMSTRRGEYITLREVLDEVGRDAARFFFIMRRTSSHLDFDLDVAKAQTSENPVYYVQYAHARICSILRSATVKLNKNADLALLKEKEELDLIKKILQFSYILNACLKTQDPYMLTVYLQELSETFHKFYDLHRVLTDDANLTQARLGLIEGTRILIATGLDLLGVSTPEKM
ncbi:MAG: arginine--tRNA ligase [Candidatus Omnitrophica bacterium]|nr:arginine--tRNA ligase [Candidatus Omnitrophota bacterium]